MKNLHTPGPWKTDKDQKGLPTLVSAHGRGLRQFICDLDTESYTGSKSSIGIEERIANARLIASAPELLEASEQLIEAMNQKNFFMEGYANGSASISEVREFSAREHEAYSKLFDVIKKAKGL